MKLKKIRYASLNARQKEIFNFQKVAGLLADYGFNCIKLADDWQGAVFLAYHKDGKTTLKVQLKSRLMISKKYLNQAVQIAFPVHRTWYVVEHDHLVKLIKEHTSWLASESWRQRGKYSAARPNSTLIAALEEWKL